MPKPFLTVGSEIVRAICREQFTFLECLYSLGWILYRNAVYVPISSLKALGRNIPKQYSEEVLCFCISSSLKRANMANTLLEVHVVFRHGDRTPDKECLYPTDPHKDHDYHPWGHGQLTKQGKRRAYSLGQNLRKKYGSFLGETYTPYLVESWASCYDRTKMTLQLVLAAMFPPKGEQVWDGGLAWQPIPYNSGSRLEDKLFTACLFNPLALKAYDRYLEGPGKDTMRKYSKHLKYLQENSGCEVNTPRDAILLASALSSQKAMGLELPPWAENVWSDQILGLVQCEYDVLASCPQLKYFTVGKLLEKIVGDARSKAEGKSKCKLRLYSGHEFSLGVLLRCLGTEYKKMPSYCANLVWEFHKIGESYGFKVYYQTDLESEPELLEVPNCGTFCTLEKFVELIQDVLDEKELNPGF